jgi:hypothetical protein
MEKREIMIEGLEVVPSNNPEFKWVRLDLTEENLKLTRATKANGSPLVYRVSLDQGAIWILVNKEATRILYSEQFNLVQAK